MNLKDSHYGKCVYSCDNNVSDNIISVLWNIKIMLQLSLNITAFTKEEDIDIRLLFTYGEIWCLLLRIILLNIKKFIIINEKVIKINEDNMDNKLIKDFFNRYKK